jgi:hypothetical protein
MGEPCSYFVLPTSYFKHDARGSDTRYNARMESMPFFESLFICLALGGAACGLLQFGVGALLWAEQKFLVAVGLVAALCGLYLGLLVVFLIISPHLS